MTRAVYYQPVAAPPNLPTLPAPLTPLGWEADSRYVVATKPRTIDEARPYSRAGVIAPPLGWEAHSLYVVAPKHGAVEEVRAPQPFIPQSPLTPLGWEADSRYVVAPGPVTLDESHSWPITIAPSAPLTPLGWEADSRFVRAAKPVTIDEARAPAWLPPSVALVALGWEADGRRIVSAKHPATEESRAPAASRPLIALGWEADSRRTVAPRVNSAIALAHREESLLPAPIIFVGSVEATLCMRLTVYETLEIDVPDVPSPLLVHNLFNVGPLKLDLKSKPTATRVSSQTYTGTQTLDFTALLSVNGAIISGSGLKVRSLLITNLAGNSGPLTVAPSASQGLDLYGAGSSGVEIQLGATDLRYFGLDGPLVSGTARNVTVTPSNNADRYNVEVLFG